MADQRSRPASSSRGQCSVRSSSSEDLALPESQLVMETENFFGLAHGQSLLRHDVSSAHQWRASRRRIVQRRSFSCGRARPVRLNEVAGGLLNPIPTSRSQFRKCPTVIGIASEC